MERLRREFVAILQQPETRKHLATDAAEPLSLSPAEFRKMVRDEVSTWRGVAQTAGINLR
jgi:tripartite-type tricarboxylate transporter receptor subunit TctC